jgi:hypothetical protein
MKTPTENDATPESRASDGCMARLVRDFDFERGEEYNQLLQLINLAGSLNKGSGIVDKIKTMECTADLLTRSDMIKPRQSFMQWLGDVAFHFHSENA